MHPTWLTRVFTALLAVWFTALTVEPAALGSCPRHGIATADALQPAHVSHGAASDHGLSPVAPEPPASSHDCTCLGHCCSAGPIGVPGSAVALTIVIAEARSDSSRPRKDHVAAWADFVLPFATAPPPRTTLSVVA